jgi:hypothetical protein
MAATTDKIFGRAKRALGAITGKQEDEARRACSIEQR